MMQVSTDTPDKLAEFTRPLVPVAKCAPKKQIKEILIAPRTHPMFTRRSGALH